MENHTKSFHCSDDSKLSQVSRTTKNGQNEEQIETLTCVPVNFTYYDELIGIAQRFSHPITPEPEASEPTEDRGNALF